MSNQEKPRDEDLKFEDLPVYWQVEIRRARREAARYRSEARALERLVARIAVRTNPTQEVQNV